MPLFMDFHKGLSASVEDVKKAHIADEAVQSKYGVTYHQFWINEENGNVFCLMEGPDKESCEAVHREAHGNIACSIVEVATGFYKVFMGDGHLHDHGHVKNRDGTLDLGIRNILVINIQCLTTATGATHYPELKTPYAARNLALAVLEKFNGREVKWHSDDVLTAVFNSSTNAVQGAVQIQNELLDRKINLENHEWNIGFKIGLCAGQPVTEHGDFFSEATRLARRLCNIANDNELLISSEIQEFCNVKAFTQQSAKQHLVRLLTAREQAFITSLYTISEEKLSDESFTVDSLSRNIGMSRPQLYRKMISLTGKPPNDFIRDLRMDKALSLIRKKAGNISEIALEVGYNNPSYFAKCFQVRYGCTPSKFVD